jgi:hypothetical protein
MDFDEVERLRRNSAAWRLLNADNAALVLAFLGTVFVDENVRSISAAELASRLEDELHPLRERLGQVRYPKSAKAYLEDWSRSHVGWLRKYYPAGSDEAHFDATPAVGKALTWVRSLQTRAFVGTESRLNIIFELLRQMVFGAETGVQDGGRRGDSVVVGAARSGVRMGPPCSAERSLGVRSAVGPVGIVSVGRRCAWCRARISLRWAGGRGRRVSAMMGDRTSTIGDARGGRGRRG